METIKSIGIVIGVIFAMALPPVLAHTLAVEARATDFQANMAATAASLGVYWVLFMLAKHKREKR